MADAIKTDKTEKVGITLLGSILKQMDKVRGDILRSAYLEYQRLLNIDWNRIETASQNGLAWISNTITHVSNTIGSTHSGTFSHVGIPLESGSAGLILGLAKR